MFPSCHGASKYFITTDFREDLHLQVAYLKKKLIRKKTKQTWTQNNMHAFLCVEIGRVEASGQEQPR